MVVLDSSALVDFLKGDISPVTDYIAHLEKRNITFAIPLICCQEVLQGARSKKEWKTLSTYLKAHELIDLKNGWKSYEAAAAIFYACRRQGVTPRSSIDCIIAQITIEHKGALLHKDRDFINIAKHSSLKIL